MSLQKLAGKWGWSLVATVGSRNWKELRSSSSLLIDAEDLSEKKGLFVLLLSPEGGRRKQEVVCWKTQDKGGLKVAALRVQDEGASADFLLSRSMQHFEIITPMPS